MGYEYRQWVLPEPASMQFLPASTLLPDLVRDLERLGWLTSPLPPLRTRHPVGGKPESRRVGVDALGATVDELLCGSGAVLVELPVIEGSAESSSEVIGPGQCYAADLLLSRELCFVPSDGVQDGKLVCHGCGGDLSPALAAPHLQSIWQSFWGAHTLHAAKCPVCHVPLPSEQVWHHVRNVAQHSKDQAPFFRFALRFDDGAPSADPAPLDPSLSVALEARIGIRLRACGRWT